MSRTITQSVQDALYPPLRPCMVCGLGHTNRHPFCGYNCNDIAWRRLNAKVRESIDQTAIKVPSDVT